MVRVVSLDSSGNDIAFVETFVRTYGARFSEYHLAWSVFFVAHMSDLRRHLGNLDDALLLAAIGLGPVGEKSRKARRSARGHAAETGRTRADQVATNAMRLADSTGIPRETVRRRLEAFRRRGWVEQAEDRTWRLSIGADGHVQVAMDLAKPNADLLERLGHLMAHFARLDRSGPG